MKKNRSIQIQSYGEIENLIIGELMLSKPGTGDVIVQNRFSGINFIDIYMRKGIYAKNRAYPTTLPLTLGMEGAGTVAETGPGMYSIAREADSAHGLPVAGPELGDRVEGGCLQALPEDGRRGAEEAVGASGRGGRPHSGTR